MCLTHDYSETVISDICLIFTIQRAKNIDLQKITGKLDYIRLFSSKIGNVFKLFEDTINELRLLRLKYK
jgi:5'-deoxynucleotidase YfbR-like HD superfamily hydrolase